MKDTETKKTKNEIEEPAKEKKTSKTKVAKVTTKVKKIIHRKKEKEETENDTVKKTLEFSLVEVVIIILITAALVSLASGLIVIKNFKNYSVKPIYNRANSSNEIIENYNYIIDNYVDKIDPKELSDAAIQGMYNYLQDEYSVYISKDSTDTLQKQLSGRYSGVGIEITMNESNEIVVNRVFENSPAQKAGILPGDVFLKLDDIDLSDKTTQFVADTIQQSEKADFNITYKRDGKETTVKVVRELVEINSVSSSEYDNVGYIKVDTFSGVSASQIKSKLDSFSKNINSLVIDLRDNTGGYLTAANEISDLFLKKGTVIYQIKDREGNITSHKASTDVYKEFKKITVLINENSASASEILTLALKENLNATVVGTKSFGKGTVQEAKSLSSGAMVKYTTSYWLSPKGNSINKIGIKPDIEIEGTNEQLEKAIAVTK